MEKALRWAIFSAQDSREPTLTAMVLPNMNNNGTSYSKWLRHPSVQEVATIKRNRFKFKDAMHWATDRTYAGNPKTDICILIVANHQGLQRYVKQDILTSALRSAAQSLGYAPETPNQIRFNMEYDIKLRGLYPPKHYPKAECIVPQMWAPAINTP